MSSKLAALLNSSGSSLINVDEQLGVSANTIHAALRRVRRVAQASGNERVGTTCNWSGPTETAFRTPARLRPSRSLVGQVSESTGSTDVSGGERAIQPRDRLRRWETEGLVAAYTEGRQCAYSEVHRDVSSKPGVARTRPVADGCTHRNVRSRPESNEASATVPGVGDSVTSWMCKCRLDTGCNRGNGPYGPSRLTIVPRPQPEQGKMSTNPRQPRGGR